MNQVNLHERAVSYGYAVAGGSLERGHIQDAYEKGATEQREIDIQHTCKWLYNNLDCSWMEANNFVSKFKQYMIKGE